MDRRLLLSLIAGTAVSPGLAFAMPASPPLASRLRLKNPHTGETFDGIYRDENGPLAPAMADLSLFLRDFHCGAAVAIDIGVIDFLTAIIGAIGADGAVILSAYRTPETNAMLARSTFGVAENSQHLYGRALDIHFPTRLVDAMIAAREMKRGGVGWYPSSGFMHIDTGPVRNWDLDERGLGSLLFDGRGIRFNHNGEPMVNGAGAPAQNARMLPQMKQSGRLLPEAEASGRILPELKQSGRVLPGIQASGQTLPLAQRGSRALP